MSNHSSDVAKRHQICDWNAIFKKRAQSIECSFGCVTRSAVLSKPNVTNILLFTFCEQKFVQHGPITIACSFSKKKMVQLCLCIKIRTKQWLVLGASSVQSMRAGFLCPKCVNFACLHDQNELHLKIRFFFAKIGIFCNSITKRSVYNRIQNHIRSAEE